MVQTEEWGVVRSPCVSRSPALLPATRLWLAHGLSQPKGLSLPLACRDIKGFAAKSSWMGSCVHRGWDGGRCFGNGAGGEGVLLIASVADVSPTLCS